MRAALVLSLLPGLALAEAPAVPTFLEEAAISHELTGEWEFMVGGGAAVFDCNEDALPDLALSGGTSPSQVLVNTSTPGGPLSFAPVEAPLPDQVSGLYPLDIDSDGITDLMVLRVGVSLALRGQGDCRFAPADWGLVAPDAWTTAFAATWEAGEVWPTLALGTYIDRLSDGMPWGSCTDNVLIRPEGAGFGPPIPLTPAYCPLSMLFSDWNRSGTPALRVSNDREYYKGGQEQMWEMPPGAPPRLLTEAEGWQRLRIWGMGIASTDLTGDGYPEYFLTSMADSKLQTLAAPPGADGTVRPSFSDIAYPRGVIAQRPYTGGDIRPSTGWHAQFEDVNNDGRVDLFIAKGNVWEMPDFAMDDPNNLLLQRADGTFEEAGDRAGVASMLPARGGALADFNADGWVDLVVVNRNAPAQIWRNLGTGAAPGWIAIRPRQPGANRDAVNGWVEVRTPEGVQLREITVGGGHAGGVLGPQHFGLGGATEAEVRVLWPDGTATEWQTLTAGALWEITPEGASRLR